MHTIIYHLTLSNIFMNVSYSILHRDIKIYGCSTICLSYDERQLSIRISVYYVKRGIYITKENVRLVNVKKKKKKKKLKKAQAYITY